MRTAEVFVNNVRAAVLEEHDRNKRYVLRYMDDYQGLPISLTLPVSRKSYEFDTFPPFFDGLLPEGQLLDAMLRNRKLDAKDYFGQLVAVGEDLVGHVTVRQPQ